MNIVNWAFGLLLLGTPSAGAAPLADGCLEPWGPDARMTFSSSGELRVGTHLRLTLPNVDAEELPSALMDAFPSFLPRPEGLIPQTRVWQLGPIEVIHQTYSLEGVEVEGLSLTLHRDRDGRIRLVSAPLFRQESWKSPPRLLTATEALERAIVEVPSLARLEDGARVAPGLEATPGGIRAFFRVGLTPEPPSLPLEVRVDATDGQVYQVRRRVVESAGPDGATQAMVFKDSFLDGKPSQVTLSSLQDAAHLNGSYVKVWQFVYPNGWDQTAEPSSGTDPIYDYPPIEVYQSGLPTLETQTDSFAEVMMYYHVTQAHDYFNDLGYYNDDPSTGIDRPMDAWVNYRNGSGYFDNAYYSYGSLGNPGEIVFGQGEATDFSYDSSVIYHEYGHAVVDGTSRYLNYCVNDRYGADCTQGGLNEGVADYFASSLRGDPIVGEYALGVWDPSYDRDLRNDLRCPEDLYGEEHEDGRIWGGTLWELRTTLAGSDTGKAHAEVDPVLLASVTVPVPDDVTEEFGTSFTFAADVVLSDLEAAFGEGSSEVARATSTLSSRGMLDCTRFVPMGSSGGWKSGAFSTAARPSRKGVNPAGLQYVLNVSEDATSLTFSVTGLVGTVLYAALDRPVEFSDDGRPNSYELTVDGSVMELELDSSPALMPGHTYYVTFTSSQTLTASMFGAYYDVQASVTHPTVIEDPVSGCGCEGVAVERGGVAGWLSGFLLFAWQRSRRFRRPRGNERRA